MSGFFFFFSFCVLSQWDQQLKRICSSRSRFFSFRVEYHMVRICLPGKHMGSHKIVPLEMT